MKYLPDQVGSVESALASAKASFEKKAYKAAPATAQDVATKAKDLGAAATAKKAELTKAWEDVSGGLPYLTEAIKSRVAILSRAGKLPAGLDKAEFDEAKVSRADPTSTAHAGRRGRRRGPE
jgi:hypothetical protein